MPLKISLRSKSGVQVHTIASTGPHEGSDHTASALKVPTLSLSTSGRCVIHPCTGAVLHLPTVIGDDEMELTHAYYSPSGRYLVGFTGNSIVIRDTSDTTIKLSFPYSGKINSESINHCSVGVKNSCSSSSSKNWPSLIQFSLDEQLVMRCGIKNEVHFYSHDDGINNYDKLVRIRIKDISFALLNAKSTVDKISLMTFCRGTRNMPSRVSLYTNLSVVGASGVLTPPPPSSSKSQIADEVSLSFSQSGKCGLALLSTSVDRTGTSYYGTTHAVLLKSEVAEAIALPKNEGPVHALSWHPTRDEFVACAGNQPSCSALYDAKGIQTYIFGTSHRNTISFNPFGNLMCLGGFGNLAGGISLYRIDDKSNVNQTADFKSKFPVVSHAWSPDGLFYLCATTSPRHVLDNGYVVYDHFGKIVHEWHIDALYEARWLVDGGEEYLAPIVSLPKSPATTDCDGLFASTNTATKYIPPSARGRSTSGFAGRLRAERNQASTGPGKVNRITAEVMSHRAKGGVAGGLLVQGTSNKQNIPMSKAAAKRARAKLRKKV
mmetsp:Transcript_22590/g.51760  ORF Transcript_22590/g.51760 Transcript_22590/m.51760 type:complete len:548 (-) Transcript_22590:776-2419(-)